MGMDIHMDILDKSGNPIFKDIYDGRDSLWFHHLMGDHYGDPVWVYFNDRVLRWDRPDNYSDELYKEYLDKDGEEMTFGWRYFRVGDFRNWYAHHNPDLDAGWCTKREAWQYRIQKIMPDLKCFLDPEDIIADMEFIEVHDEYDSSTWLLNFLGDKSIKDDCIVSYSFDN